MAKDQIRYFRICRGCRKRFIPKDLYANYDIWFCPECTPQAEVQAKAALRALMRGGNEK